MSFPFINKTLRFNNLKTRKAMNAKISVFVICVEAMMYLLLYNLYDSTFNWGFNHKLLKKIMSFLTLYWVSASKYKYTYTLISCTDINTCTYILMGWGTFPYWTACFHNSPSVDNVSNSIYIEINFLSFYLCASWTLHIKAP